MGNYQREVWQQRAGIRLSEGEEEEVKSIDQVADDGNDLAKTVSLLRTLQKDPDLKKKLGAGAEDGLPDDEQVTFRTDSVACLKMFPTQKEIGFDKSVKDILTEQFDAIKTVYSGAGFQMPVQGDPSPISCFEGGGKIWILDGHHRWSLAFMINPESKPKCSIMSIKGVDDPKAALKLIQMAIAAKGDDIPSKKAKGDDLMDSSEEAVKKYVLEGIQEKAIKAFKEGTDGKLDTKEKIADHVAASQPKIAAMAGDFPRPIMPQAGDASGTSASDVENALKAGEINYMAPFDKESDDVKEAYKREVWQQRAGIKRR